MIVAVSILGGVLAIGVTLQAVFVLGYLSPAFREMANGPVLDFARRAPVNLLVVAIALFAALQLRLQERSKAVAAWSIIGICFIVSGFRYIGQFAIGLYSRETWVQGAIDNIVTASTLSLVFAFALWITHGQQRARRAERIALLPTVRSSDAATAMLQSDLRRRRAVAYDARHAVDEHLARADRELRELSDHVPPHQQIQVEEIRSELKDLRDGDLRRLVRALQPAAADDGVIAGLRALIGRIPPTIDVSLSVPPEEDLPTSLTATILAIGIAEDAIGAALQYGRASRLRIALHRRRNYLSMTITDDGTLATDKRLSDLDSVRRRVVQRGGHLEIETSTTGHTLHARIPLH